MRMPETGSIGSHPVTRQRIVASKPNGLLPRSAEMKAPDSRGARYRQSTGS
jgi:hypothetical protein